MKDPSRLYFHRLGFIIPDAWRDEGLMETRSPNIAERVLLEAGGLSLMLLPFRKVPVTAEKPASYSRCTCDPKFFPDRFSQVGSSCLRCGRWLPKESPCVVEVYSISTYLVSHKRVCLGFVFVYYYIIIRESRTY